MPEERPDQSEIDALLVALRDEIDAIPIREGDDRRYPEKERRRRITALAAELSVRGLTVDQIGDGLGVSAGRVRPWVAEGRRERGLPRTPRAPRVPWEDPERVGQLLRRLRGVHPRVSAAAQRAADQTAMLLLRANLLALEIDLLGEALDAEAEAVERMMLLAAKAYATSLFPHRPRAWTPKDACEADQILVELAVVDDEYQQAFEEQRSLILELRSLGVGTPTLDSALGTSAGGSKRFIAEAELPGSASRRPTRPPLPAVDEAFSNEFWKTSMIAGFDAEFELEADFMTLSAWVDDLKHLYKTRLLLAVEAHLLGAEMSAVARTPGLDSISLGAQIARVRNTANLRPLSEGATNAPAVLKRRRLVLNQLRSVSRRIADDEEALNRLEDWIGAAGKAARVKAAAITRTMGAGRPSISKSDPALQQLRQSMRRVAGADDPRSTASQAAISPAEAGTWGSYDTRRRLTDAYARLEPSAELLARLTIEAQRSGVTIEDVADIEGVAWPTRRVVDPVRDEGTAIAPFVARLTEARRRHEAESRDLEAMWLQLDASDFTLLELATAAEISEHDLRRNIARARKAADLPGTRSRSRLIRLVREMTDQQRQERLIEARGLVASMLGDVSEHPDDRWAAAQEAFDGGVALAAIARVLGVTVLRLRSELETHSSRGGRGAVPDDAAVRETIIEQLRAAAAEVREVRGELDDALRTAWAEGMRSTSIARATGRAEPRVWIDLQQARGSAKDVD